MTDREIYANAPVVLVALELRHPSTEPLSGAARTEARRLLSQRLPIPRELTVANVQALGVTPPEVTTESALQYLSRDRTMAVTFRRESVVVETTRYDRYERFRDVVALAVGARHAIDPLVGVERLGLRYINEIRAPGGGTLASWEPWVEGSLLGPRAVASILASEVTHLQSIVIVERDGGKAVALRYGPRQGYAVDPAGNLKRPASTPGPFFLLDIDSFWSPLGDIPEPDLPQLLAMSDELHEPVRSVFESLITERLREEVLRHGGRPTG